MKPTRTKPRSSLRWKPAFPSNATRDGHGIYGERVFAQVAHYEKVRADRLNSPLSMVHFQLPSSRDDTERVSGLVEALRRKVRATDLIGWLDDRGIGVLLPSTGIEGARSFAATVSTELPELGCAVEIMVHPRLELPVERALLRPAQAEGCDDVHTLELNLEQVLVHPIPLWKRTLDIIGAGAALIVLFPLFAVVAIYIKLVSPGPAFFTQHRVGRGGREFNFVKFRTMHANTDESLHHRHASQFIQTNGGMDKLDEADPRIFIGGRLLRLTCIDELPQLWNVLRGEMSLVGPRPCIPYEAVEYHRWHRNRFSMLPGMSGLWQVSGKNKLTFAEMIRLDIRYEKTMSLGLDLLIILRTIPAIVGLVAEAVGRKVTRIVTMACLLLVVSGVPASAQSVEVNDGSNAIGFGVSSEFGTAGRFSLTGYSAFSIAGIMDIGGVLGRETETINGVQGENMTLGFVYNVIPVRQSHGVPFSVQLRLTYGLTLINRDLVVAELLDRFGSTVPGNFEVDSIDGSRSGYSIGAGISHDIDLGDPLWLRLGADVEFRSARSTYSAVFSFSGEEETTAPRSVGFRETTLLYMPNAAVSLRIPDGPVVSFGFRFWFDEDTRLIVRPELNLVLLQYQ